VQSLEEAIGSYSFQLSGLKSSIDNGPERISTEDGTFWRETGEGREGRGIWVVASAFRMRGIGN